MWTKILHLVGVFFWIGRSRQKIMKITCINLKSQLKNRPLKFQSRITKLSFLFLVENGELCWG